MLRAEHLSLWRSTCAISSFEILSRNARSPPESYARTEFANSDDGEINNFFSPKNSFYGFIYFSNQTALTQLTALMF
jgi:hypothetical protein